MSQQFQKTLPVFEGNQVLTSAQLNQLVTYLDEQNRITRAKLIGMGIVCGLEITPGTSSPLTFNITKGMGVTSMGYLITQCDTEINRYKTYTLPDGVSYAPFEDPTTKVQDVTLYELLDPAYVPLPGETVLPLSTPSKFLSDKVVLLFLEISDKDQQSCLGMSCDEKGKFRQYILRRLLVSKGDMENKIFPRTCQQDGLFPDQYELPEIIMRRVLFDPISPNSKDYFKFSENYVNAIRGNQYVSYFNTTKTTLYDKLFDALRQTYVDFAAILGPVFGGANPFNGYPNATWTAFLNGSSAGPRYLGMQYFYDFINDMILAYNEFRDNAMKLMSECCANMDCFPQHLMLGEAMPPSVLSQPSRYRHGWMISPAFNSQSELLQKCIGLFKRMVLMAQNFNLTLINNPSTTPIPPSGLGQALLITPSKEKIGPLSQRSIPCYYKINEPNPLGTLNQVWNYEYTRRYLFSKGLYPLAYGNQDVNQLIDQGPVLTPMYYDIDQYNFYRIETPIRQSYVAVTAEIKKLQQQFDLPFNVVTVRLSGNPLDDISERCDFDDIRTEYGTLRTTITSLLQDVFNHFGLNSGGAITHKPWPAFLTELTNNVSTVDGLASVTQPLTGITFTVSTGGFGIPIPIPTPVFAPERTMSQAIAYINSVTDQMVLSINDVINSKLPFDIAHFNFGYTGLQQNTTPGFIQSYLNAVQNAINAKVGYMQLFDLIARNTRIRNTPDLLFNLSSYIQENLGLLERFITDSTHKSLTLLNYTFQYRFQYLKDHDQTLFSNFIQNHPGIEHKSGVGPGGTLILVVPGNAVTVDPIKRAYTVAETRDIKATKVELEKFNAKEFKSVEDEETIKVLSGRVLNYSALQVDLAIGRPVQKISIEPYQVIADFSLPYLCCCDCECEIPHVTEATQLNMPAIAQPFYVPYNLGDYAYGHDLFVTDNGDSGLPSIEIHAESALQYQRSIYAPSQVRLYLINRDGVKLTYKIVESGAEFVDVTPMSTYNYPNDPFNTTVYGTVKVRVYLTGLAPTFIYTPGSLPVHFRGIDSFSYMFEILDDTGKVVSRSDMATVNINVIGG